METPKAVVSVSPLDYLRWMVQTILRSALFFCLEINELKGNNRYIIVIFRDIKMGKKFTEGKWCDGPGSVSPGSRSCLWSRHKIRPKVRIIPLQKINVF